MSKESATLSSKCPFLYTLIPDLKGVFRLSPSLKLTNTHYKSGTKSRSTSDLLVISDQKTYVEYILSQLPYAGKRCYCSNRTLASFFRLISLPSKYQSLFRRKELWTRQTRWFFRIYWYTDFQNNKQTHPLMRGCFYFKSTSNHSDAQNQVNGRLSTLLLNNQVVSEATGFIFLNTH